MTISPERHMMAIELAVSLGNEIPKTHEEARPYFKYLGDAYGFDSAYWFLGMVARELMDELFLRFDDAPGAIWDAWEDQLQNGHGGVFLYDASECVLSLIKAEPTDVVTYGDAPATAHRIARAAIDRLFSPAPTLDPLAQQITSILSTNV
jgi:hypothetical protein